MPDKPKVVFADIPITAVMQSHLDDLVEVAELIHPGDATTELIASSKYDALAWISRVQPVTDADMSCMREVKMVSAWGVGYDHIDIPSATARGIPVSINPHFSRSVAEAALTLIFALAKRLRHQMRDAASGVVRGHHERGTEIQGKTLGIVGYGRIGRELGELGRRLGMSVVATDPYLQPNDIHNDCRLLSLDQLLSQSDFVVLTAALTPETKHMIDSAALARMKSTAYLINVGRGGLVNESALLSSLLSGQIAGAGLDVWEIEPVTADNQLLALDNVIGTPHRLAATWESLERVCRGIAANVRRVLSGQAPLDVVNAEVLANR